MGASHPERCGTGPVRSTRHRVRHRPRRPLEHHWMCAASANDWSLSPRGCLSAVAQWTTATALQGRVGTVALQRSRPQCTGTCRAATILFLYCSATAGGINCLCCISGCKATDCRMSRWRGAAHASRRISCAPSRATDGDRWRSNLGMLDRGGWHRLNAHDKELENTHMKYYTALVLALIVVLSGPAMACPEGQVPCGENSCCRD